jgi:hypothetical protein
MACRDAADNRVRFNIPRHDGIRCDYRTVPDGYAAHNYRIDADPHVVANHRGGLLCLRFG